MAEQRTFGRRVVAQPPRPVARPIEPALPQQSAVEAVSTPMRPVVEAMPRITKAAHKSEPEAAEPFTAPSAQPATPSVDDELREWKKSRKTKIPWRQLSLMASLSFGIASFELTGEIGNAVEWLLYGLSIGGAYYWWTGRKSKS